MKRNKIELRLTLLKIFGYVIIMSLFESIWGDRSGELGRVLIAGPILLVLALDMRWRGEHFSEEALSELPYRKLLYLLPMVAIATANLWHGAVLRFSAWDTVCYIAAMLMIGVIEELLFRGYLLRLLERRSVKTAILVSSLTFGLGHIVNLANGAELLPTLLQLVYALAIGLMLSVFMVRAKNIVPCCIFHGVFNALAAFSSEAGQTIGYQVTVCAGITVISLGYALYLWKKGSQVKSE